MTQLAHENSLVLALINNNSYVISGGNDGLVKVSNINLFKIWKISMKNIFKTPIERNLNIDDFLTTGKKLSLINR